MPQHVQRGDAEDLRLAALEQRRAVHPREHLDLGRELADVGEAAAVDADLVAQDPLADQLLAAPSGSAAEISFSRPSNCSASAALTRVLELVDARSRAPACRRS